MAVFRDDADREDFLRVLGQVSSRTHWRCYGYCLLPDRYEALIHTPEPNLSRGMRQLNGVYTQRYNERHGHEGQIFRGRFKAVLVERGRWLAPCLLHLLALRTEVGRGRSVDRPLLSSLPALLDPASAPPWLDTAAALRAFGPVPARARSALLAGLTRRASLESVWSSVRGQIFLGSDRFIAALQSGRTSTARQHRPGTTLRAVLRDAEGNPKQAMARAYLKGGYNMEQIARHFGVHYSTVSRAVKAFEEARAARRG